MPNLNVNEQEGFEELPAPRRRPRRPQRQRRGGGVSPVFIIIVVVIFLGVGVYLLNSFGIVQLWGDKEPEQATQELPPPVQMEVPEVVDTQAAPPPEIMEVPPETTAEPPAMRGPYAFQVSSWLAMSKAQEEAERLKEAGFDAFFDEITMEGTPWYRVLIGYYPTASEAKEAAEKFSLNWESGYYIVKIEQ